MGPKFKEEQVARSARAKEDDWFRRNEQELIEAALERQAREEAKNASPASDGEAHGK